MNTQSSKKDSHLNKNVTNIQTHKRNKNTLKALAMNFFDYLKKENKKVYKIDDIVKKLNFSKRRIYDITNVLEGIGVIKKLEKNKIELISKQFNDSNYLHDRLNNEINSLSKEEIQLKDEERLLDNWITELNDIYTEKMRTNRTNESLYLNYEQFKSLSNGEDVNMIGFSGLKNSKVIIPDPNSIEILYHEKLKEINNKKSIDSCEKDMLKMLSKKHHMLIENPEENQFGNELKIYMLLSSNTIYNKHIFL